MAGRKANGEGTISTVIRNGKTYYKANITVGWDSNGKQIRKSFGSYKKSVVLDKMNTAKYQAKTNSLSNSTKFLLLFSAALSNSSCIIAFCSSVNLSQTFVEI